MPKRGKHRVGDYLVTCDMTGKTFYASETVTTWNNFRVGRKYNLPRNPQDFPKYVKDDLSVPEAKPWIPNYVDSEFPYWEVRTLPSEISGIYNTDIASNGGGELIQIRV